MKKYPTVIQFSDSVRLGPLETDVDAESYFQLVDEQRNKLELGVISKTKLLDTVQLDSDDDENDDEARLNGQIYINGYRLGEKIGSGQFGTVYKGYSTGKVVAMKQIYKRPINSPFSMSQIMKTMRKYDSVSSNLAIMEMNVSKIRWECFVTNKLIHPNITSLIECLDSPYSDQIWLVQQLAQLGELQWSRESKFDLIEQWQSFYHGHLTSVEEFVIKIMHDVSSGLNYLEKQGIIHRDIKPQNILLDPVYQNLSISDFGCSLMVPNKLPFKDARLDKFFDAELNKIVGTPLFTAPELCNFEQEDVKVHPHNAFKIDVWSLGITLYSVLYNSLPFWGESEFDTYRLVCHQELKPQIVRNTSDENNNKTWIHDYVVTELLRKDPQHRPSAQSILHTLELHSKPELSSMNKLKSKVSKWKRTLLTKNKTENLPSKLPNVDAENSHSEVPSSKQKQPLNRSHRATVNLENYIK